MYEKLARPVELGWAICLNIYFFCFILFFSSSSPCRKDQFGVSYFSSSLIVLIQVYNWEIRHHSFVCCCGLADILYILELSYRLVTVSAGTTFLPINGAKPAFICSWITLVFHEAQSVREAGGEFNADLTGQFNFYLENMWQRKS